MRATWLLPCTIGLYAASPALARDLYVPGEYATIGAAIDQARAERLSSAVSPSERIVIHVAPGRYVGSVSKPGPGVELLPLYVDFPNVELRGSTVLTRDAAGWPVAPQSGSATTLVAKPPLSGEEKLIVIGPTAEETAATNAAVQGFVLDGGNNGKSVTGFAVLLDRVQGFALRGNVVSGVQYGVRGRASSGSVEGNHISGAHCGICLWGGNTASPANVVVRGNRSVANVNGGLLLSGSGIVNVQDAGLLPLAAGTRFETMTGEIAGNDLSDNNQDQFFSFGVRLFQIMPQIEATQTAASLSVSVHDNRLVGNAFAVVIDAGFPRRDDPRGLTGAFHGTFSGNEVTGSKRAAALVTFTRSTASTGNSGEQLHRYKYLQGSTYVIEDPGSNLAGAWLDNSAVDPRDGRMLGNSLIVNGTPFFGRNFK